MTATYLITNIGTLLTLEGAVRHQGRRITEADLGLLHDACLVVQRGKIAWAGERQSLPSKFLKLRKLNAGGALIIPGFVDSHTHLVFAGDRSREFEMRLAGKSYQEIARAGGGIVKSMKSTREASESELLSSGFQRVEEFLKQGVTTLEIKTGYGLSFEAEKKCLSVITKLKKKSKATIKSTYLAAHAIPEEFRGRKSDYINELTFKWLPKLKNQCDFVDIFLDEGYFDKEDAKVLLTFAKKNKIPIKLHADEIELTGGTETAIAFGALSADHLLKIGKPQIQALAKSEVTATLLPTTALFLNAPYAPARELLNAGARVALATDFNPGTSPTQDISIVGLLAALQMKMRMDEIIVALTLNGAYALGLQESKGALIPGYDADFMMIESDTPARLFYEFGRGVRPLTVYRGGERVFGPGRS